MRLEATHMNGSSVKLVGLPGGVKSVFAQWWNSCNAIEESEPDGPQKNGAEAQAERSFPRYFETEGIHQDIPIIQARMGFAPNKEAA